MEALYTLILYPLLCGAAWYLGSYAKITAPVHTRLPGWLQSYLTCPACSGTLYGFLVAVVLGRGYGLPFLGLSGDEGLMPILVAGCSMIWTPVVGAVLMRAMTSIEGDVRELTEGSLQEKYAPLIQELIAHGTKILNESKSTSTVPPTTWDPANPWAPPTPGMPREPLRAVGDPSPPDDITPLERPPSKGA